MSGNAKGYLEHNVTNLMTFDRDPAHIVCNKRTESALRNLKFCKCLDDEAAGPKLIIAVSWLLSLDSGIQLIFLNYDSPNWGSLLLFPIVSY
jgi:hypothetical protein